MATDVKQILNVVANSFSIKMEELRELFAATDENTPIVVISAIGSQNTGKSMLLNFLLAFLKGGCNQSWSTNGETKLEGFRFGSRRKHRCIINACLVYIEFDEHKLAVLLLDAENGNETISAMNSKLQLLCTAISSTIIYVKKHSDDTSVDPGITSLMERYSECVKGDSTKRSSLLTLLTDTPDHLLPDVNEEVKFKTGSIPTIPDNVPTSLKNIFEESFTYLLPNCCESLPDDFQGELKYLDKIYKNHLKSFLMSSFSLFNLLEIKGTGKCYRNRNEFLKRLKGFVEIRDANSLDNFPHQKQNGMSVAENSIKLSRPAPAPTATSIATSFNGMSNSEEDANDNELELKIIKIEKGLKKCLGSLAENFENCTPQLLEDLHSKYEESLKVLESARGKHVGRLRNKTYDKLPFALENKIKVFTIEKTCIQQLCELQTEISKKLAEQLYYPIEDFKRWTQKSKTIKMNATSANTAEIPEWFELYLDIVLNQGEFLNDKIRETERNAIDEAISIALGFYETKMRNHVEHLIFKESELNNMDQETLDIVQQSLEYGTNLKNQRNIALHDFDAMQSVKERAKSILENLKKEFMEKNYTSLLENANKVAVKAFKIYQTRLQDNIRNMDQLKVTKLYEFHLGAKENALNMFYEELTYLPKDSIEPCAKNLSEDIDAEHRRIRNAKVTDSESTAAMSSILGIQFGLAEIRFGIYKDGNPKLYRISKSSGIPNFIDLSDNISVGSQAEELYVTEQSGFKMENILQDKVGSTHDAVVMGRSKTLQQEVIVSLIFGYIKAAASEKFNEDIYRCVITIPNAFDHVQRKMVMDSASLAGFEVVQILSENAAAAVTYRFHPEYQYNPMQRRSVNLLVHSYVSEYENDTSSVFKVTDRDVTMLSSCSPPFVKELKDSGLISSILSAIMLRKSPTDNDIILCDATEKANVENEYCMLIKSGQCRKSFSPDRHRLTKFCKNITGANFSTAIVFGAIYFAEAIRSRKQFSVTEALQYGVTIELEDKSKKLRIERNTLLPITVEISSFALTGGSPVSVNLFKHQGKNLQLGSYSIDARLKSSSYDRGEIIFQFDRSGLLTTKGFILTGNGNKEIFVTQQTNNMNEHRRRELSDQLKQIYNMEKDIGAQQNLRMDLHNQCNRIKGLVAAHKSLPQSFECTLRKTFVMCEDVIKDKNSSTELLKQQLEFLRNAEENFLQ